MISKVVQNFIKRTVNSNTFGKCIKNVKLITVDNGKCKAELEITEEHTNSGGTLHGGFSTTLVDCLSTYALMSYKENLIPGVSVDLHVTFMRPAFPGDVIVIDANTTKSGKTMAFLDVDITKKDTGALIARGRHTKYIGG